MKQKNEGMGGKEQNAKFMAGLKGRRDVEMRRKGKMCSDLVLQQKKLKHS